MRFLTLTIFLFSLSAQAAPSKYRWTSECGEVRMARTKYVKSRPVVYLHTKSRSFVMDPGALDKGFGDRSLLIQRLEEFAPVCITGYFNSSHLIPFKAVSATRSRLAERRQQQALTETRERRVIAGSRGVTYQ